MIFENYGQINLIDKIISNISTILAIYGSIVSSVLLWIKYREWQSKTQCIKVALDFITIDTSLNNYPVSGRYGDQYIKATATNFAHTPNTINEIYFEVLRNKLFRKGSIKIEVFPPNGRKNYFYERKKIGQSESAFLTLPINVTILEFDKSLGGNIRIFEESLKHGKYYRAVASDALGYKYFSKIESLPEMIQKFHEREEKLATEDYRKEYYGKKADV